MDLSEMKLASATFEVRYDEALVFWDRSGAIWQEMRSHWSGIKPIETEPNRTSFVLDRRVQIQVEVTKAFLIMSMPQQTLRDLSEMANTFMPIVSKHLNLTELTRVALRLRYEKDFPSREKAAEAIIESNLLRLPGGKHFGIDGQYAFPEYSVRLMDSNYGITIRLKADGNKTEFIPPFGSVLDPIEKERQYCLFDLDYFTTSPVPIAKLNANEWISQSLHIIKRDHLAFLKGTN